MSKKLIRSMKAPEPIGPYSQAVFVKDVLYVSGQIAINPSTGNIDAKDISEETHQVLKNIKAILEEATLDMSHIVKTSIFLKDMNNFAIINKIYGEYFKSDFPARETVEVSRLPKDVNVEISCIAVK